MGLHQKLIFPALALVATAFAGGIVIGRHTAPLPETTPKECLRLGGYTLIRPLLACDTAPATTSPHFTELEKAIENRIKEAKDSGAITSASVYLRDPTTRQELNINSDEKFYPASLKKVPLLIQYFKSAQTNPGLLDEHITITDPTDYNAGTVIIAKQVPEYGKTYTVRELLTMMIRYSDNTSFQVLLKYLGVEKFEQSFANLQLHYPDTVVAIDDYMTPYQFMLFFRTLYNATYLNPASSEEVLALLSTVDFKDGIAKPIPEDVAVAHKFGVGVVTTEEIRHGELHDCGIIYEEKGPYMLCVMTKSTSLDITEVQQVLSSISKLVYDATKAGFK